MRRKTSFAAGLICLILCLSFLNACRDTTTAQAEWLHVALSKDGTPITYEVYGAGEPALVFVHGWSCDSRYWRKQIPYFSFSRITPSGEEEKSAKNCLIARINA